MTQKQRPKENIVISKSKTKALNEEIKSEQTSDKRERTNRKGRSSESDEILEMPSEFLCTPKETKTGPHKSKRVIYHQFYGSLILQLPDG